MLKCPFDFLPDETDIAFLDGTAIASVATSTAYKLAAVGKYPPVIKYGYARSAYTNVGELRRFLRDRNSYEALQVVGEVLHAAAA